ncbi:MAG: hypothetical protein SFY69_03370 [Planctomycetota bacterium]|nr:hypothetical protein [Planctomycetota bacterium]
MPFVDTWKTAKKSFETMTHKKKPTDKFLGVFRKGTGVEEALKSLDKAKTGAELTKALATFKSAAATYTGLLEKTATDPSSVKAEEKSTYVAATNNLKAALKKIEEDAGKIASTMGDVGDKDKTTADEQMQKALIKEAEEHIKLREQVAKDAQALLDSLKKDLAKLTTSLSSCEKQVNVAKEAAKSGNLMGGQVAVGVIDRFLEESEALLKTDATRVKDFTKDGSPMMKARSDAGATIYDRITGPKGAELKQKRDKVWGPVTKVAAEQNTVISQMEGVVQKMSAARATAESSGSTVRSPSEYIAAATKVKQDMEKAFKDIRIKSDRVVKALAEFDTKITSCKGVVDVIAKHCRLQEEQWQRYGPETKVVLDRIQSMKTQGTSVPKGALEDKGVDKAVKEVGTYADECIKTLTADLKAGADLEKKISETRQKHKIT